ncbi:hypothetical protein [Fretibacter rubidus]|uniref:hypothetical protein n=1 Tax=Fretibacter rubidus TaxID=570162 RepID=UPI00352A232F
MRDLKFKRAFCLIMVALSCVSVPAYAAQAAPNEDPAPREKAGLPETDIFLFDIILGQAPSLSNPRNVTTRAGYDNQPSFTADSQSFLYSRGDDYQTDVYEYDIKIGTSTQITNTITSEFSPVSSPDNTTISFVSDGPGAAQTIVTMQRDGSGKTSNLLPGDTLREPIGYYAWNHGTGDVLYWSRYGFNVSLTDTDGAQSRYISGNAVPSTPYVIPSTNKFSFVHRQGDESVWIKELDPETHSVRPLTALNGPNANYAWAPDGSVFIIQDDGLYRWQVGMDGWADVAELPDYGIEGVARLSFSPDGKSLAVVGLAVTP